MNEHIRNKILDSFDIDTRLKLGLPPRQLNVESFEWMMPRYTLIYHTHRKTLFRFEPDGHLICVPIRCDRYEDGTIFNLMSQEYLAHAYGSCGCYILKVLNLPFVTELKVKFVDSDI